MKQFLKSLKPHPSHFIFGGGILLICPLVLALVKLTLYKNFDVDIECKETGKFNTNLTNLGVIKNSHFSGNLHYDTPVPYDSGSFMANLCQDMTKSDLVHLLWSLAHGKFSKIENTRSWPTTSLTISAEKPFVVEYDGEVITTRIARFSILPKYIKVCQ